MSQENVELLHKALDAYNRHDLDAYLALMHDDVEARPRMAGWRVPTEVTRESGAGGSPRSTPSPTSGRTSSKCAT